MRNYFAELFQRTIITLLKVIIKVNIIKLIIKYSLSKQLSFIHMVRLSELSPTIIFILIQGGNICRKYIINTNALLLLF